MRTLTEPEIRAFFVNTTRSERAKLTLPANVDELNFDELDYFGWRDPRLPHISYVSEIRRIGESFEILSHAH